MTDEDMIDDVPRMEVIALGRNLGTASGWDRVDTEILVFYDFEPGPYVRLPIGDLTLDFEKGVVEVTVYDKPIPPEGSAGTVIRRDDIVSVVANLPLVEDFPRVF